MLRALCVATRARRATRAISSKANSGSAAMCSRNDWRVSTAQVQALSAITLAERGPPSRLISPK